MCEFICARIENFSSPERRDNWIPHPSVSTALLHRHKRRGDKKCDRAHLLLPFNLPDRHPSCFSRRSSVAYVTKIYNATVAVVPSDPRESPNPIFSLPLLTLRNPHPPLLQFQAVLPRQRVLLPAGEVLRARPHARASRVGQRRRRARHSRPPLRQARPGAPPRSGESSLVIPLPSLETFKRISTILNTRTADDFHLWVLTTRIRSNIKIT